MSERSERIIKQRAWALDDPEPSEAMSDPERSEAMSDPERSEAMS
jgi:hypothetical protein